MFWVQLSENTLVTFQGKASAKKGGSPVGSRDGSRSRSGSRGGASRSPSKERKGKKGGKSDSKKGNDDSTASQEKTAVDLTDGLKEAINKEVSYFVHFLLSIAEPFILCSFLQLTFKIA